MCSIGMLDLTWIGEGLSQYEFDLYYALGEQECSRRRGEYAYCCIKTPTHSYVCIRNINHQGPHMPIGKPYIWYT